MDLVLREGVGGACEILLVIKSGGTVELVSRQEQGEWMVVDLAVQ